MCHKNFTKGSDIGRTTIEKRENSSDAQMAEIAHIISKGMIQS